jgi:hypothetical protein
VAVSGSDMTIWRGAVRVSAARLPYYWGVTKKARAVKRLWRDYNLSVVLDLLFIASWVGQLITQWFI